MKIPRILLLLGGLVVLLVLIGVLRRGDGGGRESGDTADRQVVSLVPGGTGDVEALEPADGGSDTAARAPSEALRKAHARRNPTEAQTAMRDLALASPWKAVDLLNELSPEWWRSAEMSPLDRAMLSALVTVWGRTSVHAAGEWAAELSGPGAIPVVTLLAKEWAEQDPVQAANWVRRLPVGDGQDGAGMLVALRLLGPEPAMALDLLGRMHPSEPRERLLLDLVRSVSTSATQNIEVALAAMELLGDDQRRVESLEALLERRLAGNEAHIGAWVMNQQQALRRSDVLRTFTYRWSERQMDVAARWANGLPDAGSRSMALLGIAERVVDRDPAAALHAVDAMNDAAVQRLATTAVVRRWSATEPEAVAVWLQQLPAGDTRDHAIAGFVEVIYRANPETALQWVDAIGDPRLRAEKAIAIANEWFSTGPEAVMRWIETAPLSDDLKALMLRGRVDVTVP